MTGDAGGAGQAVIVPDMAIGALPRRNGMHGGKREAGAVVIEACVQPGGSIVAGAARLREVRRHVIGIRRALVILQVAGHAGRAVQAVVVVNVAIGALPRWNCVHAGQGEGCEGVIE